MSRLGTWMRPPSFWDTRNAISDACVPLSFLYTAGSKLWEAAAHPPTRVSATVICVGSALVGGAGKTPVTMAIANLLVKRRPDLSTHVLSRGYGGTECGPLRVDANHHSSAAVGDEPLLLAETAPTWIGARRSETARAACAKGANILLMDDGLQHSSLFRNLNLLCLQADYLLGNQRVLPAGPLRESFASTLRRCDAIIALGCARRTADGRRIRAELQVNASIPIITAAIEPDVEVSKRLKGQRVIAFSGIARPERFFCTLSSIGCIFACVPHALPDHAEFTPELLDALEREATSQGAQLVTTCKDAVRLPSGVRKHVVALPITLRWTTGEEILEELIDAALLS